MKKKTILIIVGASGSGKTTVAKMLEEKGVKRLITTTTRPMRESEVDGVDYHFIKEEEIPNKEFVERVVYNGYHYGLTKNEVDDKLSKHNQLLIVMDKNGARTMKSTYPNEVKIAQILVSKEDMMNRLSFRGESESFIESRIAHAELNKEFDPLTESDLIIEGMSPLELRDWLLSMMVE